MSFFLFFFAFGNGLKKIVKDLAHQNNIKNKIENVNSNCGWRLNWHDISCPHFSNSHVEWNRGRREEKKKFNQNHNQKQFNVYGSKEM